MVADYIQAQLKMSEVQLLYAKKSLRHWNSTLNTSSPSDSPPLSFPRQQQLDRHGTGDTDVSETNLALVGGLGLHYCPSENRFEPVFKPFYAHRSENHFVDLKHKRDTWI